MRGIVKPIVYVPLVLIFLVFFAITFSGGTWRHQPVSSPILLIGVDGIEWDLALPLIAEGRMPTIERLMGQGRYGFLNTLIPTVSPVIWTTVATGMTADDHGIRGFAADTPQGLKLYSNSYRRASALWNILSDFEKRVCVVGWWMTYPAEQVNGVMVAQTNTLDQFSSREGKVTWKGALRAGIPGQVYPPELEGNLMRVLGDVEQDLPRLTEEIFGRFPHPLSPLGDRLWSNCTWSFRADQTYSRIARQLITEEEPFDLAMVYFGGSDVAGHRFLRYMKPELYNHPPAAEQITNFGGVIASYYTWLDSEIGRLIDLFPEEVSVVILSDHGMIPVNRENRFDPEDPPADVNSAHHPNGPPGIFIAAGPFIEPLPYAVPPSSLDPDDLSVVGSVYDLAPTILAMLRIPRGLDMEGRVLDELFAERFQVGRQPRPVRTHITKAFKESRRALHRRNPGEATRIEQLQSLGYLSVDEK